MIGLKKTTLTWLQQQCSANLLAEKWLLCDSLRTAQIWKDRINLTGMATVNLHSKTLRSIVLSIVGDFIAASKLVYLDQSATESMMQGLIDSELENGKLLYFTNVKRTEGLAKLAARSIRDLRLAGVDPDEFAEKEFESPEKRDDLKLIYQRYVIAKQDHSLVDYADCLELAKQRLENGTYKLPAELLVLQPHSIHWQLREMQFLAALESRTKFVSFSSEVGNVGTRLGEHNTSFFSGYGEINEIRGVVQKILGSDAKSVVRFDDVEIVYASNSYVPLIYEFFEGYLPIIEKSVDSKSLTHCVTFAEGIATIYSRPGRALRAWLRWVMSDGQQSKIVQLVREGVLSRSENEPQPNQIGYSRLAANLRQVRIGFKLDRYIPAIESAITAATKLQSEFIARRENGEEDKAQSTPSHDDDSPRDFGLPALNTLLTMIRPLVELAPGSRDSAADVLRKAKRFILGCVRYDSKLDRLARNKLLDAIDGRLAALQFIDESSESVTAWLEGLPLDSSILDSGPQPGCAYATSIGSAGHSGRKHVFVVGMDASSFPNAVRVDPLLLDNERKAISKHLSSSLQLAEHNAMQLSEMLQRTTETENVQLTFSYATRSLIDDRQQSPSPALVELYRQSHNRPEAHLNDLLTHIGDAVSFASTDSRMWLSSPDGGLAEMLTTTDAAARQAKLESGFPHFQAARVAVEKRELPEFTEFDGFVPEAGSTLSPDNPERMVSSSRLETFGSCPRRFLFKYGLGVYPPDEWNIEPERWLDPMTLGNLVHGLFERFMRELTSKDLIPELERDLPRLLELLDDCVSNYLRDFPAPSEDAFQRQMEWLRESCEIFLEKEQAYCQSMGARPWVLEAAIGLDEPRTELDCREPVSLCLNNGQIVRIGGRIDRIDRLNQNGSESYAIWDYKTGSDWGFSVEDPFMQGRKLQSFLYVGMLRHRLADIGKNKDVATSFGYFFPNAKTQGQRIEWTSADLNHGDAILQDICQLIQRGVFPATTDSKDCQYCDYNTVCQDTDWVAAESIRMSLESRNQEALGLWRKLREF